MSLCCYVLDLLQTRFGTGVFQSDAGRCVCGSAVWIITLRSVTYVFFQRLSEPSVLSKLQIALTECFGLSPLRGNNDIMGYVENML